MMSDSSTVIFTTFFSKASLVMVDVGQNALSMYLHRWNSETQLESGSCSQETCIKKMNAYIKILLNKIF